MNTLETVVVVGGGLAGLSAALALRPVAEQLTVLSASELVIPNVENRALALTWPSVQALSRWLDLDLTQYPGVVPIQSVRVSVKGRFGAMTLSAAEAGFDALGWMVPAQDLIQLLISAVSDALDISVSAPATVDRIDGSGELLYQNGAGESQAVHAQCVVAADGARSALRSQLGIAAEDVPVSQSALVFGVELSRGHESGAHERFLKDGVLAMMPRPDRGMTAIYTGKTGWIDTLNQLDDGGLCAQLQGDFSMRLGRVSHIAKRACYPLQTVKVSQFAQGRVALVGNAAHALHPIGAQGMNLAVRDIGALQSVLGQGQDVQMALQRYTAVRQDDVRLTQRVTGLLAELDLSRSLQATLFASGLGLADLCSFTRRRITNRGMGLMAGTA